MINKKVTNPLECRWYFTEGKNSIIIISPQRNIMPHFNKFYFVFEKNDQRISSSLNQGLVFDRYEECYEYISKGNIFDLLSM